MGDEATYGRAPGFYMSDTAGRMYPMNRVPGWLAGDTGWKDTLDALAAEDVDELEAQWELAGGVVEWQVDTSWLEMERTGEPSLWWPIGTVLAFFVLGFGALLLFVGGGS